jgi:hypothetical protein
MHPVIVCNLVDIIYKCENTCCDRESTIHYLNKAMFDRADLSRVGSMASVALAKHHGTRGMCSMSSSFEFANGWPHP